VWAIVPAAGIGQRIQPIACSKELLPVGYRAAGTAKRPKAVSEYLLERLILAGARKICLVISPEKSDIVEYYGERFLDVPIYYAVQARPRGLCDALFRARPLVGEADDVLFGLPDTIWFPNDALCQLPGGLSSLLLFPVNHPSHFDVVLTDARDHVINVEVKVPEPHSNWIWGAGRLTGRDFNVLESLWRQRQSSDEYLGTLFNAYLANGGRILAVRAGQTYLDVGTYDGFRAASTVLGDVETQAS
jgi:glucose-1-phosphate thymidylyltransferase